MERQPIYLKTEASTFQINLGDDELSLQIALGYMDYAHGFLPEDEQQNLRELIYIKYCNFFAGADHYIRLYGIDGALKRFRQSRIAKPIVVPTRASVTAFNAIFITEKILDWDKVLTPFKKDLLKIS